MKKAVIAVAVVFGLCAGSASHARANGASDDMTKAANHYYNARDNVSAAYNAAKSAANKDNLSQAWWAFYSAAMNAENAEYYFAHGDYYNGGLAAWYAYDASLTAQAYLNKVTNTNPTIAALLYSWTAPVGAFQAAYRGDCLSYYWELAPSGHSYHAAPTRP